MVDIIYVKGSKANYELLPVNCVFNNVCYVIAWVELGNFEKRTSAVNHILSRTYYHRFK